MPNSSFQRTFADNLSYRSSRAGRASSSLSILCERFSPMWPLLCLVAMAAACLLSGCQPESKSNSGLHVELELTPSPPTTGDAGVVLTLSDASNQPVEGAHVELEGNMNHAGMKPVFSTLQESGPGKYEGNLTFTMGGDWFVLVTGELSDGTPLNEKVDVPGVKAQ